MLTNDCSVSGRALILIGKVWALVELCVPAQRSIQHLVCIACSSVFFLLFPICR